MQKEGFYFNSSYGNVIISALRSYLYGVQGSKKTVVEKLGSARNLEKLDNEIKFCEKFLVTIHESYPKKT